MKRTSLILMVMALTFSLAMVVDADAGWFGKKDTEEETNYRPRYDNYPSMGFHKGVLHRDARTGWRLGDLDLQFMSDCKIVKDGVEGVDLQEGRPVLITGPRWGNTVVAWRVRIMDWEQNYGNHDPNVKLTAGDTPYVSVGVAPQ